jgi:hypothetical protein
MSRRTRCAGDPVPLGACRCLALRSTRTWTSTFRRCRLGRVAAVVEPEPYAEQLRGLRLSGSWHRARRSSAFERTGNATGFVISRHEIQTYFRVPGTNNAPEGAVRAPCTRVEAMGLEPTDLLMTNSSSTHGQRTRGLGRQTQGSADFGGQEALQLAHWDESATTELY